jgi:hypothetical protein
MYQSGYYGWCPHPDRPSLSVCATSSTCKDPNDDDDDDDSGSTIIVLFIVIVILGLIGAVTVVCVKRKNKKKKQEMEQRAAATQPMSPMQGMEVPLIAPMDPEFPMHPYPCPPPTTEYSSYGNASPQYPPQQS